MKLVTALFFVNVKVRYWNHSCWSNSGRTFVAACYRVPVWLVR